MAPNPEKLLFFDTNFIRSLTSGLFQEQLEDPSSDLRSALSLPFTPWRTAHSTMELLGLRISSRLRPVNIDFTQLDPQNFTLSLFEIYQKHFSTIHELDSFNLKGLLAARQPYVQEHLKPLWNALTAKIFRSDLDVSSWLRFALSFDALHKFVPTKSHLQEHRQELLKLRFSDDYQLRNLSQFRLAYRIWVDNKDQTIRLGCSESDKTIIDDLHNSITIKNWEDYADGDLVHVASYGIVHKSGGRQSAICLTCDKPEVVTSRLRIYKGLLSDFDEQKQLNPDTETRPDSNEFNGTVLCFDSVGSLKRKIDVKNEVTPIKLIRFSTN